MFHVAILWLRGLCVLISTEVASLFLFRDKTLFHIKNTHRHI